MTQVHVPVMKDWFILLALIMLWGTSFMFISVSLESISPVGIVSLRVFLSAIILTAYVYIRGQRLPANLVAWGVFLLLGLVGNLLPFYFISVGQQSVTSGMAGLLMAFMPLVTMILAHYFVSGEDLNRFKILGFILGVSGVVIVLWPSLLEGNSSLFGSLLILAATVCYAVNTILVKRLPSYHPLVTVAGVMIMSSVVIVPIWWVVDLPWQQSYSMPAVWSVIWLGIGPTALATLLLFVLIGRAGPTFLANINYVIPVVAYFTGALVLGEVIEWRGVGAMLLIILGIALTRKKPVG